MQKHYGNWCRVSRPEPCPICGKPDNCQVSKDGAAVWCGRVSDGSIRQNAGGQFLHVLKAIDPLRGCDYRFHNPTSSPPKEESKQCDWAAVLSFYSKNAGSAVPVLAERLGVSAASLKALQVGWHPRFRFWTFPERDADGRVIGVLTREESGRKKRIKGSKSGLCYAANWDTGKGPILLVEGPSDTAALTTIGLAVVGRPSNSGGVRHLIALLFEVPAEREIIVIGERDEKPNGKWPGREGSISTSTQLAEGLERPIAWAFPPDNAKDTRAWLTTMPKLSPDRLADLFVTGLDTQVIDPPPIIHVQSASTTTCSLASWRDGMVQARLQSLGKPGIYLDRSPTGAGKSHVDLIAIKALLKREGAA